MGLAQSKQEIGRSGEGMAASFFIRQGYQIKERNWRCRQGEIDLIVFKPGEWRFIEVKTRSSNYFGYPEEAVTPKKQEHFLAALEIYSDRNKLDQSQIHADVISILLNEREFDVQWIKDAF